MPSPETPPSADDATVLHANKPAEGDRLALAEKSAGLRCDGCGRRIHNGFAFTRFLERFDIESGGYIVEGHTARCCVREDCGAAAQAQETAHVVRTLEIVWPSELRGEGEPPLPESAVQVPSGR